MAKRWPPRSYRSLLADAIGRGEERNFCHNSGTPRCPRLPRARQRKLRGLDRRFEYLPSDEEHDLMQTRELIRQGYYDELRRAFHDAVE